MYAHRPTRKGLTMYADDCVPMYATHADADDDYTTHFFVVFGDNRAMRTVVCNRCVGVELVGYIFDEYQNVEAHPTIDHMRELTNIGHLVDAGAFDFVHVVSPDAQVRRAAALHAARGMSPQQPTQPLGEPSEPTA